MKGKKAHSHYDAKTLTSAEFFIDDKVEGTFLTAASRAAVDEYIQKEIQKHEEITRYYKERHNALSFTCRLPQEILGTIFKEVAIIRQAWQKYQRWGEQYRKWGEFDWIKSVSHVCSHWRVVALSDPSLWSNIRLMNTAWTPEMIQRSMAAPLTITLWGSLILRDPKGSYTALREVIHSHLSRIRSLTLGLAPVLVSPQRHELVLNDDNKRCLDMFSELLPLLDQPAPMLECLELNFAKTEHPKQLPDGFVIGLSQLKHLRLEGWSMDWKITAFENLKSLFISCLPADGKPTVNQLLDILMRTPLLESLTVVDPDVFETTALAQEIAPICLEHLKHIDIAYSLPDCVFFFNHIIFSTQVFMITVRLPGTSNVHLQDALPAIETLARRLDIVARGPIFELKIECKTQCCKANGSQQPLNIDVYGLPDYGLCRALKQHFWQSLYLDKLRSLEISKDVSLTTDDWKSFGALPSLKNLRIRSHEWDVLNILEQGTAAKSDVPTFFVSLKTLTLIDWDLGLVAPGEGESVMEQLIKCFDCRRKVNLRLDELTLEGSVGPCSKKLMNHLKKSIECVNVSVSRT